MICDWFSKHDTAGQLQAEESASQEPQNKIRLKSRLTYGSLVMAKQLDLGVDVMHGCFTERGDSILGVFSWELLRAKLQHK